MPVPWSTEWNRLLDSEEFGAEVAQEARDYIVSNIGSGICPACWARNFGRTEWQSASITTDTHVCLTCEIIWPPPEILDLWDFIAHPDVAPIMGATMRQISDLARIIQAKKERA